jgi:serine/threonine protein kinase
LSSENVLHLDLKSVQFIYFPKDDRIKLTDFGSALYLGSTLEENAKKLGLVG